MATTLKDFQAFAQERMSEAILGCADGRALFESILAV